MKESNTSVIKNHLGCDFVVKLPSSRAGKPIKMLQLSDPQVLDADQRRTPDRIPRSKVEAWAHKNFDAQLGNHIRSLITQTRPDFIFIAGDVVYGEFDDNGSALRWMVELMDSFRIPWAPVFGNHDNESAMGVDYQCRLFEESEYCLFARGEVSGNSNYSVGIAVGDELVRVFHMLDSNGCRNSTDPSVIKKQGIYPDQLDLVRKNTAAVRAAAGKSVPAFMSYHIPHSIFVEAEREKGYITDDRKHYIIGVDVEAKDGDFGFNQGPIAPFYTEEDMSAFLEENDVDGVFVGHHHVTSTVIHYHDTVLAYGLKTGLYDSHVPGNVGGTLITQIGDEFSVLHVSSLCNYGPIPVTEQSYDGFFLYE